MTPLAPRGSALAVEAPVTSVGCGHGANPTPWETHITAVNRYQGHANVEAARAPEEGRSGGGLFNAAGQLIGVCFAADPQGNEGLYASIDSIYQKLDALNLSDTLQTPPGGSAQPMEIAQQPQSSPSLQQPPQLAAATAPFEVRGQSPIPRRLRRTRRPPTRLAPRRPPLHPRMPVERQASSLALRLPRPLRPRWTRPLSLLKNGPRFKKLVAGPATRK